MLKKSFIPMVFLLCFIVSVSFAQDETLTIEPVWELYNTPATGGNPYFPFMIPKSGEADGAGCGGQNPGYENNYFDMDLVSSLVRYDDERLLLFVVENGINEEDPDHDAAMAAQYPDRTIWWIDDLTGAPLGIALQPQLHGGGGVTFTREGTEYTTLDFWPTSDFFVERALDDRARSFRPDLLQETGPKCAVDAEGNVYVNDRHNLLRYTPDGNGGFNEPTLAFEYPKVNPPVMPDGTEVTDGHYRSWSMKDVEIIGVGQNKVMTTTGRHWLDGAGVMYYESDNGGETFTMVQYKGQDQRGGIVGTGGGCSASVVNSEYNDEYVFACGFPGSDRWLYRMYRPAGTDETFFQDPPELWNRTPQDLDESKSETQRFMGWEMCDCAAAQDIPYVAVLSIPKWKSLYEDWTEQGGPPTAWIALISYGDVDGDGVEGDVVGSYAIPFKDEDEPNIPGTDFDEDAGAAWQNCYQVSIEMYVGEDFDPGAFEILVSGGGIGYGRYKVGNINETPVQSWSLY